MNVKILVKKMWPKIKIIFRFLMHFFVILSIVTFLVNILYVVLDSITDPLTSIFSVCGFCFILISITYEWMREPVRELISIKDK